MAQVSRKKQGTVTAKCPSLEAAGHERVEEKMRNKLFLICIAISFLGCSQKEKPLAIDFGKICNIYDKSFVDYSNYDDLLQDSFAIENELFAFFNSKDSQNVNIEEKLPFITVVSSADDKIRAFSWDTKRGGTLRDIAKIIQYVSGNVLYAIKTEEGQGAEFDSIYSLGDNMYLFSGITRIMINQWANTYFAIKVENDKIIPVDIPVHTVEYQGTMAQGSRQFLINFYINWLANGEIYDASYQYAPYNESIWLSAQWRGNWDFDIKFCLADSDETLFLFDDFTINNKTITGKWVSLYDKSNIYNVSLEKK
jgi:hypothetical protein